MRTKKEVIQKIIKNKNFIMFICVIALTVTSLGVSYASFFSVKTNTNNQTVTSGTLQISYANEEVVTGTIMEPLSDELGMTQENATLINIQNTGTIPVVFSLSFGYDLTSYYAQAEASRKPLVEFDYIKFAVFEYNGLNEEETLLVGPAAISELIISDTDDEETGGVRFIAFYDSVAGSVHAPGESSTKTYKIRMWLDDSAPIQMSNRQFYIDSRITAEPLNSTMKYNISGILKTPTGIPLSNGIIKLQNGLQQSTTNSNGEYNLTNIGPGTYNFDILYGNKVYQGNITIESGPAFSLGSPVESFTNEDLTIYEAAYKYHTSLRKLATINNISPIQSEDLGWALIDSDQTYNLYPNAKVIAGNSSDITLDITLSTSDTYWLSSR